MNLKEIDWKKYFTKKHCICYAAVFVVLALTIGLVIWLTAGGNDPAPQETTPAVTTPNTTTPSETTPSDPSETTPSYPAEGETDPKQEDAFND